MSFGGVCLAHVFEHCHVPLKESFCHDPEAMPSTPNLPVKVAPELTLPNANVACPDEVNEPLKVPFPPSRDDPEPVMLPTVPFVLNVAVPDPESDPP